MTLVELLVSVALLAMLSAAVAGAVSLGYRTFGPGGVTDRQQVATDVSVVQKSIATDVGRASCVVIPNAPTPYGSCDGAYVQTDCVSALVCIGWPDLTNTVMSCRVAVYQSNANEIWRKEYLKAVLQTTSHLGGNPQGTSPLTIVASPLSTTAPSSGVTWVKSVSVSITAGNTQLKNPPGGSYAPAPVVGDPKAVSAGVAAC